jgi:predicted molibdopterin-dependent oxidoreductase YjgC
MHVLPRGRLPLSPAQGIERGAAVMITVDGHERTAHAGETVAAALIAGEGIAIRETSSGAWRGMYCGMGACFDCLAVIDGAPNTRTCMTLVADGMRVDRQHGPGAGR